MLENKGTSRAIVGAWRLESYVLTSCSGDHIALWGDRADGIIIYLENGFMSVHVSDKDRQRFNNNDFLDGGHGEIKQAFEGYTAYFGTYEYNQDKGLILHHVSQSLYPNWSGVTHTRFIRCEGNSLLIKTPPILVNKQECVMELRWFRL